MAQVGHVFDVIIVGAGISGVSAGYHLQKHCPDKSFTLLEARNALGGTWDLFRYPGIRSDSEMYTLGFGFRSWTDKEAIASGEKILRYVEETAEAYGLTEKIRFGRKVNSYRWSSEKQRWILSVEHAGTIEEYECSFIICASGYYNYDAGYLPDFPNVETFAGTFIHPQHWPENLDYYNKKVVIIGSGATAITLAPAMAERADHITVLQRSPSYIFSMPAEGSMVKALSTILPRSWASRLARWKQILFQQLTFKFARAFPDKMAAWILKKAKEALPEDYDVETHLKPNYDPWTQRICLAPDGDFFEAITSGDVSMVTDLIERFTPTGISLKSGATLDADIVISATGLDLKVFGGADIFVDDVRQDPGQLLTYRGAMHSGIPNFIYIFGYTNASWTLRSDLISGYACRLINYLDRNSFAAVTPVNSNPDMKIEPFSDFTAGYLTRVSDRLPKQGEHYPWRHPQSFYRDFFDFKLRSLKDTNLRFDPISGVGSNSTVQERPKEAAE